MQKRHPTRSCIKLRAGIVQGAVSLFCLVPKHHVLNMFDVTNIWQVPLVLEEQGAHQSISAALRLGGADKMNLNFWRQGLAERWDNLLAVVRIAMVGKYTDLSDAYLSVIKSLQHACLAANRKLDILWVEASDLEPQSKDEKSDAYKVAWNAMYTADGILVPGGFGNRGVEGMILAAKYAREKKVPYLGICLGMQVAVIEFARNVCNQPMANSTEFDQATPFPAVIFMPEGSTTHKGGTMRLGLRRTLLETVDCNAARLYQADKFIDERHRHRYEVNPAHTRAFEAAGLKFVGKDESGQRMEIVELQDHPFFVASQFHPEFKSRPFKPSPLFLGLVLAATNKLGYHYQGLPLSPEPAKKLRKIDAPFGQASSVVTNSPSHMSSPEPYKSSKR